MEFHEHKQAMVVIDGRRTIATGRRVLGGWLLIGRGFCWLDERARMPNVFQIVDPKYLLVKTKSEARKNLQSLLKNGVKV